MAELTLMKRRDFKLMCCSDNMLAPEKLTPMMAYWDKNLICRFANESYLDWFGYSHSEMTDKMTINEVLGPVYQLNRPFIESALAGHLQIFTQLREVCENLKRKVVAAYYPDCREGALEGFFAYVIDVTDLTTNEVEKAVHEMQIIVDASKLTVENKNGAQVNFKMFEIAETLKQQVRSKFPGLNKLALQHCISVSKLKRDFKQSYHMSPYAFFHDLKMIYADSYMRKHKCSKKEMAAMLEFSNPATFYTAFKKFKQEQLNARSSGNIGE